MILYISLCFILVVLGEYSVYYIANCVVRCSRDWVYLEDLRSLICIHK